MGWSWLPSLVHARLGSGFPWRTGLGMYLLKEKGKLDPDFFLIDSKSLHWVCPPLLWSKSDEQRCNDIDFYSLPDFDFLLKAVVKLPLYYCNLIKTIWAPCYLTYIYVIFSLSQWFLWVSLSYKGIKSLE